MKTKKERIIKPLIWNSMFEVVFDNMIEVVITMINDCCGTSYEVGRDQIKVEKRQIPRQNIKEMALTCDFIVIINTYDLYNIELNKRKYNGLGDRNWTYILKLHSSRIPVGTKYNEFQNYKAKQINFNKFKNEENIALDVEGWTSYKTNHSKYKNVGVFQFDIEYCYDLVYNNNNKNIENVPKLYRWGAIFSANSIEKIDDILGSDMLNMETKKNLLKKIDDASTDEIILSKISLEEDFEGTLQDEIEIAKAEAAKVGREEGLKQGRQEKEQAMIDTIKSMLKKNYPLTEIAEITNNSLEYIKKIKETI